MYQCRMISSSKRKCLPRYLIYLDLVVVMQILNVSGIRGTYNVEAAAIVMYSKTCVRQPPSKLTLVVDVERWLSYKGTCHVILLAKLHDMYLYKTDNFFHIYHYLKSVSKVALLHRFYCTCKCTALLSGTTHAHLVPLSVTKCRPVHFYSTKGTSSIGILMV